MRTPSLRAACLGVALVAAACASTPAISNTNNIVRATDVELVCLELAPTGIIPRPTSRCALSDADNGPGANSAFHLHAVVPQFDRGELAVVDLATTSGVALVDNSPATPGYSFLPVGEFPVSITSDIGESGGYLYVASSRSDRVLRVDAAALRSDPRRADFGSRRVEVPVGGVPRDLAVVRAGDRRLLVATLPEARAVSIVDVTDPAAPGAPQVIALRGATAVGDAGAPVPAHPVALAIDEQVGRVYVTDDALEVVHVLDPAARAELAPIAVGVRTRVAAVTGTVRARTRGCDPADPDHCARTRYLYLTTADQGAVVVWDLGRNAPVVPNLLPLPNARASRVDPGLPAVRVALGSPATALVPINTGAYDPEAAPLPEPATLSADEERTCAAGYQSPGHNVLSGVFVGVVLRNGQFALVDLDDYTVDTWEAQCRRAAGSTATGPYRFVRHAPHAATKLDLAPALNAAPLVTTLVGNSPGQTLEPALAPALACGEARSRTETPICNEANSYGVTLPRRQIGVTSDGAALYGPTDPFTSRDETWTFVYEGVLPGLDQTGGALVLDPSGALRLDAPGGLFCTRGALANDQTRDRLLLVSDPSPLPADAAACARSFGSGQTPVNRDFAIDRAFEGHLLLRTPGGELDPAAVLRCYPQAVQFQVRAGGQWIVVGLPRSGFAHSVQPGDAGECRLDSVEQAEVDGYARQCLIDRGVSGAELEAQLRLLCPAGRACTGATDATGTARRSLAPTFANAFVCTQILPAIDPMRPLALPVDRGTQIAFSLKNGYQPFLTLTGSLPVAARHLNGVDRLYIVDSALNGLMEFRLNPFASGRIFN